jgi:Reverse transcriptase (RNA-dependent DNA polymerase)
MLVTFQALMNSIFKPYLRIFVLIFFNDILIYSSDLENHIVHLSKTLQLLRDNQLFVKFSKCAFATEKIKYLGHIITSDGVATDPSKISAMVQWPIPKKCQKP